jgi:hypothetical protein
MSNGKEITIKKYISEYAKQNIASIIKELCFEKSIETESGLNISNTNLKNALFVCSVITYYTDIDLPDVSYLEACDILISSGLYDEILSNIPSSEINMLKEIIRDAIEDKKFEILMQNSIENQLNNFLKTIIEKIPNDKKIISMMKSLKKELGNIDVSKLSSIKDLVEEYGDMKIPNGENLKSAISNMEKIIKT